MRLSLWMPLRAICCPLQPAIFKAVFLVVFMVGIAHASELVPAIVVSVYDGDTITVEANVWPGFTWDGSVRVRGVDTPEIRGECDEEKALAQDAKAFVVGLLEGKTVFLVQVDDDDKYGRVAASVLVDGDDLAHLLIDAGFGRPYDGGARESWCE